MRVTVHNQTAVLQALVDLLNPTSLTQLEAKLAEPPVVDTTPSIWDIPIDPNGMAGAI